MSSSVIWKQGASPSSARLQSKATDKNEHLVAVAAQQLREREEVLQLTRAYTLGQGLRCLAQESAVGVGEGIKAAVKGPIDGFRSGGFRKGLLQGAIDGVCEAGHEISVGVQSGCLKLAEGYTNHITPDKKLFGASRKNVRATRDDIVRDDILDVYRRERTALYDGLDEVVLENPDVNGGPGDGLCFQKQHTELYSILGCSPNATSREVRQAFYRKSVAVHPDKNPDNPEAQEQFVMLCQAYRTLSDSVRRDDYDRTGVHSVVDDASSSLSSMSSSNRSTPDKIDDPPLHPMAVFDAMFGNNKLVHVIGDMSTSLMFISQTDIGGIKSLSDDMMDSSNEAGMYRIQGERFQAERRVWLTELLCRRLQPIVDGDAHAVLLHAHHEVVAVRGETFGTDLLRAVGSVYAIAARTAIPRSKSNLRSAIGHLEAKAEKVALRAALTEASATDSMVKLQGDDEYTPSFEQRYQSSLSRVWTVAKWDIQQTLRDVATRVLTDDSGYSVRVKRAEGLAAIASVFLKA